jgi:MYXO-CTERM domain-containing protein
MLFMHRSIRHSLYFLAAVVALVMPELTRAQTISATLNTISPYTFGSVYLQGAGVLSGGVGSLVWTGSSTNAVPFNGGFNTYCIDLVEDVYFGSAYTYTLQPLAGAPKSGGFLPGGSNTGMGPAKATEIETLYGMHLADTTAGTPTALIDEEAFQLAIWNIIYDTDNSVDLGGGSFYAYSGLDAAAISTADSYLADAASPANQARYAVSDVEALVGPNGVQDQIVVNPNLPFTTEAASAPLPAAAPGGVALLLLVGFTQWRRRTKLNANE